MFNKYLITGRLCLLFNTTAYIDIIEGPNSWNATKQSQKTNQKELSSIIDEYF